MNDAPPQVPSSTSDPSPTATPADSLPPEALALASRFFNAARTGDHDPSSTALLTQALDHGLSPNLTNDKGDSLIMLAAYHGHANLVKLLLEKGADPNRLNDRGQSPLAGVVFKNEAECIRLLLEGGADPEVGTPSALEATRVFKQEAYEAMFKEQIEKLKASGSRALNGHS